MNNRRLEIIILYFLLAAGGVWQVLGWFQVLMQRLAGPLLAALSILLFVRFIKAQNRKKAAAAWGILVFFGGIIFEWIGLRTGAIFGRYSYGDTLQPQLAGLPIAIGFAWLGIQLGALAVVQKMLHIKSAALYAGSIAAIMVVFDLFMEPAAVFLNYWRWEGGAPPMQNYLGWFVVALLFSWIGFRLKLFQVRMPDLLFHSYWAQLLYFLLIDLKAMV